MFSKGENKDFNHCFGTFVPVTDGFVSGNVAGKEFWAQPGHKGCCLV